MDEQIALRRQRQKFYRRKYREIQAVRDKYAEYFEADSENSEFERSIPIIDAPINICVDSDSENERGNDVQASADEVERETSFDEFEESSEEESSDSDAAQPPEEAGVNVNEPAAAPINIQPIYEEPEIHEIRKWAVTNRIKNNALDGLLGILGRRLLPTLPKTAKTLLKTSHASYDIRPMADSKGRAGEYVYIGVKKQLLQHINPAFHDVDEETGMKLVPIDVNVDGLKVFKSSKRDAWVISCRIVDENGLYKTFTIAVYYGHGKPQNFNLFLTDFVRELIQLSGQGFTLFGENYRVQLRYFICDTPARSAMKAIKGHTGFHSCERCIVKGIRPHNHTIFPPNDINDGYYDKRTCQSFRDYDDNKHHTDVSLLLAIRSLDPVHDFILDPMHLLYEGVMKRLFEYWFGDVNNDGKISAVQKLELNRRSAMIKGDIPREFHRKMRSTEQFKLMKGTELKFFLDYPGPVLVKELLKDDQFKNFVSLHAANRLLSSPNAYENVDQARKFYRQFNRECAKFYGEEFLSLNIHALDHVADDVENSGCDLNKISAWPFENHLYKFKLAVTNPNRVLAQYCRRLFSEIEILDHKPTEARETEVLEEAGGLIRKYKYKNYIFTNKHPDNTAYLRTCRTLRVVKIKEIFRENGNICATISDYKVLNSAFEVHADPENDHDVSFDSRSINYVEVRENNAAEDRQILFSHIQKKMIKFGVNFSPALPVRSFVVPLLH